MKHALVVEVLQPPADVQSHLQVEKFGTLPKYLADPGEARGCSTNTSVTE